MDAGYTEEEREGMSIEERIVRAVAPIGLPCAHPNYDGEEKTFLTFNLDAIPDNFADDGPLHERWIVQLHLFAPVTQNTRKLRKEIRNAVFAAGFTYPDQIDASEAFKKTDGSEQHIVFEFEDAEGI